MYVPASVAGHKVPPPHARPRFFISRCWNEGRGKAALVAVDGDIAISTERAYARSVVVGGIRAGLRDRTLDGLLRSGAIISGLAAAVTGLAAGRLVAGFRRPVEDVGDPVRVLVDHSGYDLRNLGDASMLQVCVRRLRRALPDAQIGVVATDAQRLESCCPGTFPVRSAVPQSRWLAAAPRSGRLALEQAWKASGPYLVRSSERPTASSAQPSVLRAVRDADLVVAAVAAPDRQLVVACGGRARGAGGGAALGAPDGDVRPGSRSRCRIGSSGDRPPRCCRG